MPNKKLQNATDISLFQKHSFWPINEDLIASFEILNYYKCLFDAQGFYRKSPKSELTLEIENNYKCGANTRREVFDLQNS